MKTLYSFIAALCKDQNMKLEDLQKKLNTSRTTLYRYMKGINQITPGVAEGFVNALNMSIQDTIEFQKFVSLSAFDNSLIESRKVLDDFLFEKNSESKPGFDVDMVLYDGDRYLRTFKEILDNLYSYSEKEGFAGSIKIYNCLSENIFSNLTDFLLKSFSEGLHVEAEQFIGLSEKDYLQNAYSFISTFPLMKYEKYKFYYREMETKDGPLPDSILFALQYMEDGKQISKYYVISFFENGFADCIGFHDKYMYMYLSRIFEGLKISFTNVMRKYDSVDFEDDIFTEMNKKGSSVLVKPNPCYDEIPIEVYESILSRMSDEELIELFSAMLGQKIEADALPATLLKTFEYLKKRIKGTTTSKHTDIYSKQGIIDFFTTGKLTDHVPYLPAFSKEEASKVLEYINNRNNDPKDTYALHITEGSYAHNDFIFSIYKDFGIIVEYIYPAHTPGLWKMILIQNERLASIFTDYFENHIPVNKAMDKKQTDAFIKSLIDI